MIGHWLLSLTPKQEDRLLTGAFAPTRAVLTGGGSEASFPAGGTCLVGRAYSDSISGALKRAARVAIASDRLCARFGSQRIAAAVRNRILSNRARRTLQGVSGNAVSQGREQP